jgi:hypothetical protein
MHHAMNHVRFMISPELHVVQDRVHGSLNPTWFRAHSRPLTISCLPVSLSSCLPTPLYVFLTPHHPITLSPFLFLSLRGLTQKTIHEYVHNIFGISSMESSFSGLYQ